MNIEDQLRVAWNAESGKHLDLACLTAKVRRHRRRRYCLRAAELALTLAAIAVFTHALVSQSMGPAHWLLLPFFSVFLPTAWILILRNPRATLHDAISPTTVYARHRLNQLKSSLRDLRFARQSALGLLIYALLACVGTWLFADDLWREAALWLLVYALAWLVATVLLARRLDRDRHREYRNLQDVLDS